MKGADIGGRHLQRPKEILAHGPARRVHVGLRHFQRFRAHAVKPFGIVQQRRIAPGPHVLQNGGHLRLDVLIFDQVAPDQPACVDVLCPHYAHHASHPSVNFLSSSSIVSRLNL